MSNLFRGGVLLLAAALAVPAGAATWNSYGSYEPDTVLDDPTLMWPGPPTSGAQVYFNVYTVEGNTGLNPNAAAAQTQIEVAGTEFHQAILGVWTDCNGDGYVGLAESAVREYRSELLLDDSICPSAGGNTAPGGANNCWTNVRPCPSWPATGYNNWGGWVVELIPIGSIGTTGGDRRVIKDNDAMVWGDYGRPTDGSGASGGTCALTPFPRGTMQSTGGALNHADCNSGVLGRWNQAMDAGGDPLGLRFEDEDARGTMFDVPTFGSEDSSNAIVKTGDCNAEPIANTGEDAPGGEFDNKNIYPPSTTYVNPSGNLPGTVNYTMESAPVQDTKTDTTPSGRTANCDFEDDRGADFYGALNEGDFDGVGTTGKTQADWNFVFATMTRGGAPLLGLGSTGAAGGPSDAGVEPIRGVCLVCQESEWLGDSQLVKGPFSTTRGSVVGTVDGSNPLDIGTAYWLTFYAHVGATTTAAGARTPGGQGFYGSTQCAAGAELGWICDGSKWYVNPDGTKYPEGATVGYFLARPGQLYQLRDVDCYDGGVLGGTAGVQPAFYGAGPCSEG